MSDYFATFTLIVPVFALLGIGMLLRWRGLVQESTESAVVKLVVTFFYPCLILNAMLRADSFAGNSTAVLGPLIGFLTVGIGFLVSALVGRLFGITRGKGLRTFVFAVGIYNYGYIPVPLIESMFGPNELAALFVHNVGIEIVIWTVGVSFLAGGSLASGVRRIANPMVFALAIGLAFNLSGFDDAIPAPILSVVAMLAACAVPLGLLAVGGNLLEHLRARKGIWNAKECVLACALRLGLLPLLSLAAAYWVPMPIELKRVLVIQAAMPAGIMPIVIAKHYGGQPIVAVRVAFATTVVGILSMPFWLRWGFELVGL